VQALAIGVASAGFVVVRYGFETAVARVGQRWRWLGLSGDGGVDGGFKAVEVIDATREVASPPRVRPYGVWPPHRLGFRR
jgi:hypothetical protein